MFQNSLIPALGIVLTPWVLSDMSLVSAVLALAGAGLVYLSFYFIKNFES